MANKAKRLLQFSFIGHVTAEQIRGGEEDVRLLLADLTAGFRLLTNMEHLESMDQNCAPEIARMMEILNEAGIKKIVRIVPKPELDIGLNILSGFHYGKGIRSVTCESMIEAAKLLGL